MAPTDGGHTTAPPKRHIAIAKADTGNGGHVIAMSRGQVPFLLCPRLPEIPHGGEWVGKLLCRCPHRLMLLAHGE